MNRNLQAGGDTPSLSGAPSSMEHENRFSSSAAQTPTAENKKEQGGARRTERKKGRAQAT